MGPRAYSWARGPTQSSSARNASISSREASKREPRMTMFLLVSTSMYSPSLSRLMRARDLRKKYPLRRASRRTRYSDVVDTVCAFPVRERPEVRPKLARALLACAVPCLTAPHTRRCDPTHLGLGRWQGISRTIAVCA